MLIEIGNYICVYISYLPLLLTEHWIVIGSSILLPPQLPPMNDGLLPAQIQIVVKSRSSYQSRGITRLFQDVYHTKELSSKILNKKQNASYYVNI